MSNVRDFGAAGDGKADDTSAIEHAVKDGDGIIEFPRGDYRITRTIEFDLARKGRLAVHGTGGTAKLLMQGKGPALLLKGTHAKTADPLGFRPEEWQRERMPTVMNIEIEGRNKEADGIRIVGVMQRLASVRRARAATVRPGRRRRGAAPLNGADGSGGAAMIRHPLHRAPVPGAGQSSSTRRAPPTRRRSSRTGPDCMT